MVVLYFAWSEKLWYSVKDLQVLFEDLQVLCDIWTNQIALFVTTTYDLSTHSL